MLLDTLLSPHPDAFFFEKKADLGEIATEKLIEDDETGIWIAGPGHWDPDIVKLPLALVWKTSNKVNIGSSPNKNGHLVLTRAEKDEVLVLKLFPNTKQPPYNIPVKQPEPVNAKERFSTGHSWYELDGSPFKGHAGKWFAAAFYGASKSNMHAFIVGSQGKTFEFGDAKVTSSALSESQKRMFLATDQHPPAPKIGANTRIGQSADGKQKYLLFGTFTLPQAPNEGKALSLTILVSGPEYSGMPLWSIIIPIEMTHLENGMRTGYFILNLEEKFRGPNQPAFKFPVKTYLTFLYRGWIDNPRLLVP